MKKRLIPALLAVLLLALSGCGSRYRQLDVPKEMKIDPASLSENTDNLMDSGEKTPLLAALPEEGLYVYATDPTIQSGVLVKYDGLLQFFPWSFTPQLAQPELYAADYNGDGKKDIAFVYVSSSGSTQRRENLHVLLRGEKGFEDNFYPCEKAALEANGRLSVSNPEKNSYIVLCGSEQQTFTMEGHDGFKGLYFDDWQDFTLGETISVTLRPGMVFDGEALPVYDAFTYTADIEFVNGLLSQTDPAVTF